jgi:hypothetical protein
MDVTDQRLADTLAAFEREQNPALLDQALDLVEAAEREVEPGDAAARRQAVARRLRLFATLGRHIDPRWNVDEKPAMGAPPPSTHGVVYGSGEVDPATIPDAAERGAYERALKASREYARWYDLQYQLRRMDERAMRFFERFLAERYAASPVDQREFEALLAESTVDETRKQRMRESLGRHPR